MWSGFNNAVVTQTPTPKISKKVANRIKYEKKT